MGRHAAHDAGPDEPLPAAPQDGQAPEPMDLRARLGLSTAVAVTALLVSAWAGTGWRAAALIAAAAGVVVLLAAWVSATPPPGSGTPTPGPGSP